MINKEQNTHTQVLENANELISLFGIEQLVLNGVDYYYWWAKVHRGIEIIQR